MRNSEPAQTPTWPSSKPHWRDTLSLSKKPDTPSLGKIGDARLDLVPQLADCNPGIRPTEYNVVVAPAIAAKTVGKLGVLIAPDEVQETASMAMQVGRIVAMSPIAFDYSKWPEENGPPQVGQMVWFARYAGAIFEGMDGKEYRILKDKDIGAIIDEPAISQDEAKAMINAAVDAWLERNPVPVVKVPGLT